MKKICEHLDLQVERKDDGIVVTKPGCEFFEALDVTALTDKDKAGLAEYVARGDLVGATKLASRSTVSQTNLLTALLALPQGCDPEEGSKLLSTASSRAEWSSPETQKFFQARARQATVLFLSEGRQLLAAAKGRDNERSGRCHLDVMLTDGRVKGEIMVGTASRYDNGQNDSFRRGLLAGDCVALQPMDGGHMTECEVVVSAPLILRPLAAPPPGTTGSGRPFRVDGIANRQQFSRTLTAAHLCSLKDSRDGNYVKDRRRQFGLAGKHRPSEAVLDVLLGRTTKAVDVKGAQQETPSRSSGLNESQRRAVSESTSKSLTLLQGPPGTGKTTVAVRILKAWANSKFRGGGGVLCASDSNIAVDNVVEGLIKEGVRAVRVGRPEMARPEVMEHCADEVARKTLNLTGKKESSFDMRTRDQLKQAIQEVISGAEVVCCTAIGAGSVVLNEQTFSRVLIDEAAQATELATLVPICRGSSQVVLCGDQCQLPPTMILEGLRQEGLDVSLFERLAEASHRPHVLLEVQYRMHPAIAAFPRVAFYGCRLFDGVDAGERPPPKGVSWPNCTAPVCFLQARGSERKEGDSLYNEAEVERTYDLVQELLRAGLEPLQLGLVTPYAAQVRLLKSRLSRAGLPVTREKGGVEINSVDGYQGREKDVIIISTVRSSSSGNLGFVSDWRRANVAFTRARKGLIVVGDSDTLGREPTTWAPWLEWVRQAGCCIPRRALDRLPSPKGEAQAVGLSAKSNVNLPEVLEESAKDWGKGRGAAEKWKRVRSRSRSASAPTKRQKVEEKEEGKKEGRKEKKEDKAEAKESKEEKKQRKKEKKEKKKAKKEKKKKKKKKKKSSSSSSISTSLSLSSSSDSVA